MLDAISDSFEHTISVRLRGDERSAIRRVVRNNPEKYFNDSHFVRAAVIKLLRSEVGADEEKKTS